MIELIDRTIKFKNEKVNGRYPAVAVASSLSAPSVSGDVSDGQSITISALSGESFGASGPSTEFYFDGRNGADGENLELTDPAVGDWDDIFSTTKYVSGGKVRPAALQVNSIENGFKKNKILFTPSTEVFISFWMRFDTDPTAFGPSFKTAWVLDGLGNDINRYDLVLMTKPNFTTRWAINGNTGDTGDESAPGIIDPNEWVRCSVWLKDNGSNEMGYYRQFLNASAGQNEQIGPPNAGQTMLDLAPDSTSINRLNIFGDVNNDGTQVELLVDGIYVATGSNSRARVEITDTETYGDASMTEAFFVTPTSWADQEIQGVVRGPADLSGKYLHIHNASGTHTNGGTGRLIS